MGIENLEGWKLGSQKLLKWIVHIFLILEFFLGKSSYLRLRLRGHFFDWNTARGVGLVVDVIVELRCRLRPCWLLAGVYYIVLLRCRMVCHTKVQFQSMQLRLYRMKML